MSFTASITDSGVHADGSIDGVTATDYSQVWAGPLWNRVEDVSMAVSSNAFVHSHATLIHGSACLNTTNIGPNIRGSMKIASMPDLSGSLNGVEMRLYARLPETYPSATRGASTDFYEIVAEANDTLHKVYFGRTLDNSFADLKGIYGLLSGTDSTTWAAGDRFGFEMVEVYGGTLIVWYKSAAGSTGWTEMGRIRDVNASRPVAAGKVGIGASNDPAFVNTGATNTEVAFKTIPATPQITSEGATNANTSGTLTLVNPSHQAGDILIAQIVFWGPSATSDAGAIGIPSGWEAITDLPTPAVTIDGRIGWFWTRATSGATTNPVFTRGANWDDGTDTCFGGRVIAVRNCIAAGTPWDDAQATAISSAANSAFPAVSVRGPSRTVIQFLNVQNNTSVGTAPAGGWVAGTEDADTTGTDCTFQTFFKEHIETSTSADATTVSDPGTMYYAILGVSFRPSGLAPPPPPAIYSTPKQTHMRM